MATKHAGLSAWWGYAFLLVTSLPLPLIHAFLTSPELEHHRYPWGLLPAELLLLRHFGQLAGLGPVLATVLLAASWKYKKLNSPETVARCAMAYYFVTTLYALYACVLVWRLLTSLGRSR